MSLADDLTSALPGVFSIIHGLGLEEQVSTCMLDYYLSRTPKQSTHLPVILAVVTAFSSCTSRYQ